MDLLPKFFGKSTNLDLVTERVGTRSGATGMSCSSGLRRVILALWLVLAVSVDAAWAFACPCPSPCPALFGTRHAARRAPACVAVVRSDGACGRREAVPRGNGRRRRAAIVSLSMQVKIAIIYIFIYIYISCGSRRGLTILQECDVFMRVGRTRRT